MYEEIYNQLKNEAAKKNLRESTIHAYYTSVLHFLKYTGKSVSELDLDSQLTEQTGGIDGVRDYCWNQP